MYSKNSVLGLALVLATVIVAPFALVQPAHAQFTVASWDWPADEYYQGIKNIKLYENSTGSWVQVGDYYEYTNSNVVEWPAYVGIKLEVFTSVNQTLTGAADADEGALYVQHNVTVLNRAGETIFSQTNLTYVVGADYGDYFMLKHSVILNFLPQPLVSYIVTITCEVYY